MQLNVRIGYWKAFWASIASDDKCEGIATFVRSKTASLVTTAVAVAVAAVRKCFSLYPALMLEIPRLHTRRAIVMDGNSLDAGVASVTTTSILDISGIILTASVKIVAKGRRAY